MRIALNLLYLIPGVVGGTEQYARSLLRALGRQNSPHEFLVILNRQAASLELPDSEQFKVLIAPIDGHNRAVRYAWEQLVLPAVLARRRLDLVHSLGYVGPIKSHCRRIVTIHDVNFERLRMPTLRRTALRVFVGKAARSADHIVAVSEFSKNEIIRLLNVPSERITVVYEAPRISLSPSDDGAGVRSGLGLTGSYVVAFSSASPHKN